MRVFVTGATGFIGSALVPDLIQAGHSVLGLTRSDEGAEALRKAGAKPHHGDIYDLDSMRAGAEKADAVIHLAFNHDFSKFVETAETDRRVIEAMGEVLLGSDRPLIITSGTAVAAGTSEISTELDPPPSSQVNPRAATEEAAAAVTERGGKVMVVRLSQIHDTHKQGFVSYIIKAAQEKGASAYLGEGKNRWAACPRFPAAHLYRLVLEKGQPGKRYNAVDEEGVSMRDMAEAIGERLNLPVRSITAEEASAHFGWAAHFAALDLPASSVITRKQLGWTPSGPTLVEDLRNLELQSKVAAS